MTDIPTITQEEAVEVRAPKTFRADTPLDLMLKVYKYHGWPVALGRMAAQFNTLYEMTADARNNRYVATPRTTEPAALSPNMDHAVGGVREAKISPHTGTDCDPDAHQWVRSKWGANPDRFQFTAWHMADAYQAGKNAAEQISFDERVAYEDRVLAVEMRAERLRRLIPPPSGPGSYVGDTYYPAGGTEASHRWDGAKWVWMANLVEAIDEDA